MIRLLILLLMVVLPTSAPLFAQSNFNPRDLENKINAVSSRVNTLESRASTLEHRVNDIAGGGAIAFLFGAFCALWAQNTGRGPWLWFFLGLFFSVITVIVLLVKNSNDRFRESLRVKLD